MQWTWLYFLIKMYFSIYYPNIVQKTIRLVQWKGLKFKTLTRTLLSLVDLKFSAISSGFTNVNYGWRKILPEFIHSIIIVIHGQYIGEIFSLSISFGSQIRSVTLWSRMFPTYSHPSVLRLCVCARNTELVSLHSEQLLYVMR